MTLTERLSAAPWSRGTMQPLRGVCADCGARVDTDPQTGVLYDADSAARHDCAILGVTP